MYEKKPWLKFYDKHVPEYIDYPRTTMYNAVLKTSEKYPESIAYDFMGYESTYKQLIEQIDQCAKALFNLGLRKGDRMTIAMPTTPQGIICFYAINKIGAIASMIHPLSPPKQIEFFLNLSNSTFALTIDKIYPNFEKIFDKTPLKALILTQLSQDKVEIPENPQITWWKYIMAKEYGDIPKIQVNPDEMAAILYSGGTTGVPKGIMLSNYNFIAEGTQTATWMNLSDRDSALAILPIFHGFGLGICVNAVFMGGGKSILVPSFTPDQVADLIKTKKPNLIFGVPTLYEALNRNPNFQNTDLSFLKAAFCGADTLPRTTKEKFEEICRNNSSNVQLREGYGLTEAVTGICAMPLGEYREGSIGIPFPDMIMKIVNIDTSEEAPIGQEGELCINGPAVMLGYLNKPEETAETLKKHNDGKIWLHTGDIATMDKDGFFYFKIRLKRMIKSSGFNVYPVQVENILYKHPDVLEACVIGVPDEKQVQIVKAFVVLKDPKNESKELEKVLIEYCTENLIKWSCPREIEFTNQLPKTLVGKIDFKQLEEQEIAKLKAKGKYIGEKD
ncbi:MAG: AMP-dependent synthetase [Promethearchaeota archaeon Loki_b32]|nr:MAG: AMP-dependent synthetase [Candidatus Lokiarchaeota archaeon Loki_b32]